MASTLPGSVMEKICGMLKTEGFTEVQFIEDEPPFGVSAFGGGKSPDGADISIAVSYTE